MSSAPINVRHNWSKTFWAPCPDLFIKVTARWRVLTTFVDDQFFNNSSRPFRNAFYQLAVIEWVETSLESNNFWQNVGAKTSKKNRRDGQTQRTLKVFNWFILRQISFRLLDIRLSEEAVIFKNKSSACSSHHNTTLCRQLDGARRHAWFSLLRTRFKLWNGLSRLMNENLFFSSQTWFCNNGERE